MTLLAEIDLQLIQSWRRRLLKKASGSPRIAVVGNCQSFGIAYGMKLLNPESTVDRFTIVRPGWTNLDMLQRTLQDYDYVFSLEFQKGFVKGGDWLALRDRMPSIIPMPSIVFSGFHPDTIYILDPTRNGRPLDSATGPYHSALALYGYLAGLTPERTVALYDANVFRMLGYFDIWQPSADEFLASARTTGLDLSTDFLRWSRRGCFMYSMNHPKSFVLADVARALLAREKLPIHDVDFDDFDVDDIVRGSVFPVYPPIAEYYGHRGSYVFKLANYRLSRSVGDFMTLRQFVESSFRVYAKHARPQLAHHRVEDWLADAGLGRDLAVLSAENLAKSARAA